MNEFASSFHSRTGQEMENNLLDVLGPLSMPADDENRLVGRVLRIADIILNEGLPTTIDIDLVYRAKCDSGSDTSESETTSDENR